MNRQQFFKQAIGTVIATAVGSKLDFIPIPKPELNAKLIWLNADELDGAPKINLYGKFRHGDIIATGRAGTQYLVKDMPDGRQIAKAITNDGQGHFFMLVNCDGTDTHFSKICSVTTL